MSNTQEHSTSKSTAAEGDGDAFQGRLLPQKLKWLFEERPTLAFEDEEDYDALLAELVSTYDPGDAIAYILVKDLADIHWELIRMRGMRRAAIEVELPRASQFLISREYSQATGQHGYEAEKGLKAMVRSASRGDESEMNNLAHIAADAGVTYRMLQYEALKMGLGNITKLDDAISRAERRRDHLVRMIEDRKKMSGSATTGFRTMTIDEDVGVAKSGDAA